MQGFEKDPGTRRIESGIEREIEWEKRLPCLKYPTLDCAPKCPLYDLAVEFKMAILNNNREDIALVQKKIAEGKLLNRCINNSTEPELPFSSNGLR